MSEEIRVWRVNDEVVFLAENSGDGGWHPIGYITEDGEDKDEIWCDGCCIKDKHLADMIALNMKVAFVQGAKYMKEKMGNVKLNDE